MLIMNIMEMMNPNGVTSKGEGIASQNTSNTPSFAQRLDNAVAGNATFKDTQNSVDNNKAEETVKNSEINDAEDSGEEKSEDNQYIPFVLIPVQTAEPQTKLNTQPVAVEDGADAIVQIGNSEEQIINAEQGEITEINEITIEAPQAQSAASAFDAELEANSEPTTDTKPIVNSEPKANAELIANIEDTSDIKQAAFTEQVAEEQPKFTTLDTAVLKDSAEDITDQIENEIPVIPERRPQGVSAAEAENTDNKAAEILNMFESSSEETIELTENSFVRQVLDEADTQLKNDAVTDGYKALEMSRPVIQNTESNKQSGNELTDNSDQSAQQPKMSAADQNLNTTFTVNNNFEARLDSAAQAQTNGEASSAQNVRFQILEQVSSMISDNKQEFTLQLKPYHLGGLTITLVQDQNGVTAKLVTASKDAHMLIQSEMATMQEVLRDKGIHVVEMEVIYDQMANTTGKGESDTGYNPQNGANAQHRGGSQGRLNLNTEDTAWMYEEMTGIEVLAEQGGSVEFSA